jgi:tRNA-dihydrouridine synthase A
VVFGYRRATIQLMTGATINRALSVAPMMDWTDRHCRFFHRLCAPQALLYTEMVTAAALVYGDHERLLAFEQAEHPVALQIGGSDPALLAEAARRGEQAGYDEVNLNVGCPSDRVQAGRFGACLMAEPERVAACVKAMAGAVAVPITVKTRLGIDDQDDYRFLRTFVSTVAAAGCRVFIVHARKAWLSGLSPKANREVPPLNYGRVERLKADFPGLTVILNGGIGDLDMVARAQMKLDGVMLGRRAYRDPYLLVALHDALFGWGSGVPTRADLVQAWLPYLEAQQARGQRPRAVARALVGLFAGQPGAKVWRRTLSELPEGPEAGERIRALLADSGYPDAEGSGLQQRSVAARLQRTSRVA